MRLLLFTTSTCPRCPAMKSLFYEVIKQFSCSGDVKNEKSPDFKTLTEIYDAVEAPTLIVLKETSEIELGEKSEEIARFTDVDKAREWFNGFNIPCKC